MIDIDQPLEPQIRRELVESMTAKLGYTLDAVRLDRIACEMGKFIANGHSASWSIAEAIDDELLLYGDPKGRREIINTAGLIG